MMSTHSLFRQRLRNLSHTLLLLAAMALLCGYLAWITAGEAALYLVLVLVCLLYLLNPAIAPWLILRVYRARPIAPQVAPALYRKLEHLSERAGLAHPPTLVYVPSDVMNAFTLGGGREVVIAVSDGLLRRLDLRELGAVLAHELSHVRNGDLRLMGLADLVGRVVAALALVGQLLLVMNLPLLLFSEYHIHWLPIMVLLAAPTLSAIAQLALSRTREFEADLVSAELTGDPEGLALALRKMEIYQGRMLEQLVFPGRSLPDPSLLRSHPPTEERVRRLIELRDDREWRRDRAPVVVEVHRGFPPSLLAERPLRPRWHRTSGWF